MNTKTPNRLPNPEDNKCIHCKTTLLHFRSYYYKVCVDCGQEYHWELKENQPPLIKHQR